MVISKLSRAGDLGDMQPSESEEARSICLTCAFCISPWANDAQVAALPKLQNPDRGLPLERSDSTLVVQCSRGSEDKENDKALRKGRTLKPHTFCTQPGGVERRPGPRLCHIFLPCLHDSMESTCPKAQALRRRRLRRLRRSVWSPGSSSCLSVAAPSVASVPVG